MSATERLYSNLKPERLLTRDQLVTALTLQGFSIGYMKLAKLKEQGDGPPWVKVGATILYQWGEALAWAESTRKKAEPVPDVDIDVGALL